MNSKRGQETGTALLWWVVALVVFALIIYFVYNFYTGAQTKVELLPEDISVYAGVCDTYGSANIGGTSKSSYCREFKEIKLSGSTVYLSCQDPRVLAVIKNKVDCSGEGLGERETAIAKCKELQQTAVSKGKNFGGSKLMMNQLGSCDELLASESQKTCNDLKGNWISLDTGGCSNAGDTYTGKEISSGDGLTEEGPQNYVCCQKK